MAATVKIKRKLYTKWDETDNLKRMKDSDILAEKERPVKLSLGNVAKAALVGTVAGGVAGATLGAGKGMMGKIKTPGMSRMQNIGKKAGKWGKVGLAAGAVIAATSAVRQNKKKADENKFYNERLQYAKRQALRREKTDWKQNMTQRDGYSY